MAKFFKEVSGAVPAEDKVKHIPWLRERLIFLTEFGSTAYGTKAPDSDEDIRGIAIAPLIDMFGFSNPFEQYIQQEPDLVIYDIRKFMRLAARGNPAVLEVMFTDKSSWLFAHKLGEDLLHFRGHFLSIEAIYRFQKYALSRLPEIEKTRAAGASWALNTDMIVEPPDANPQRAALITKFGYDTKEAMHAVRIIRMAKEMAENKGLIVKRPDAAELLEIRNGSMQAGEVIEYVKVMAAAVEDLAPTCKLPKKVDQDTLEQLCMALITQSFAHQVTVPVNASWGTQDLLYSKGCLLPKNLVKD